MKQQYKVRKFGKLNSMSVKLATGCLSIFLCMQIAFGQNTDYKQDHTSQVDYVNPYLGNISHLLVPTFPRIHLPNRMLRLYPERCDYTGDVIKGLPLIVTSHRGSSAFNLSPFQGNAEDIKPVIALPCCKVKRAGTFNRLRTVLSGTGPGS